MIRTIKTLLGLAGREDATTDELTPSLPAAEAELAAARAAQAAAEAAYRSALLGTDEAGLRAHDAERREAGIRIDRAEALLAALRERLEEARAREAEAGRVQAYQAAKVQADEARAALVEHFDNMASDLVRLLEVVALAEAKVQEVNEDLPRNTPPLPPVEAAVRNVLTEADEVLSEVTVRRWVEVGAILPSEVREEMIRRTSPGRGVIRKPGVSFEDLRQVELREFTERTTCRGKGARPRDALASVIALPGLRASDPDFWEPRPSLTVPANVASEAAQRRLRQPITPLSGDGFVVVELVPVSGAQPVERRDASETAQDSAGSLEAAE